MFKNCIDSSLLIVSHMYNTNDPNLIKQTININMYETSSQPSISIIFIKQKLVLH